MDDRREHERASVSIPVQYKVGSFGDLVEDATSDLSMGGMFLRTTAERAVGDEIRFQIITEKEGGLIEGTARVVRVVPGTDGEPGGIGLEFTELVEPNRSMMEVLVKMHAEASDG
jgi:c-di-GMP-binding flagellar brake protein YcgR